MYKIKLSPFGHIRKRAVCSKPTATIQDDEEFDWDSAIRDAFILSGVTLFAAFGASSIAGLPGLNAICAGFIAAGSEFFTILALKRGLIKNGK